MGTTLTNGIYLPNEGEKNCYAGLKTNWETLDQKIADIAALQQAVAGALHREIVESLPTTDIDPNTIYMVLSGTSATENVYNEFMYVNNAWELIGTSATDLTNYYTKGDVDGLLLLKANASDLTSHTGDTTIHVTANDKSKWNTVALIKQLRLVNAQVGSSTTIAFANIDDTNGIKVGDKCMDLDAKLFEITAVDTTNQTVTVSSALIDLALDANVVHTSGNETVGGVKTFTDSQNLTGYTAIRIYSPIDEVGVLPSTTQVREIKFTDKNNVPISYFSFQHRASSAEPFRTCWRQQKVDGTSSYYSVNFNNLGEFYPEINNPIKLGTSTNRWAEVYAQSYYYGSNNIEFSTKFVTTDTNQTISGNKTFSGNVNVYNSDSSTDTPNIILKNSKAERGSTTNIGEQNIFFLDKDNAQIGNIKCITNSSGVSNMYITCNVSGSDKGVRLSRTPSTTYFRSDTDNDCKLGTADVRWSDVQTYKVNALEPSALSMPDLANGIDISSYITTGDTDNNYTPPANGWIWIRLIGNGACIIQGDFGINSSYVTNNLTNEKWVETNLFVTKNVQAIIRCRGITGIVSAKFYPCLGNV